MDKSVKDYLKQVQKGIWSPFLRLRIKREILDHLADIAKERSLSEYESLNFLGKADEANQLYKKLMYKRLKHDTLIYGTMTCGLFLVVTLFIHQQVEIYQSKTLREYSSIETKYKADASSLKYFSRTTEKKNAAAYLASVVDAKGKVINEHFFSEIHQYDYWEPAELLSGAKVDYFSFSSIHPNTMFQLAKFSLKRLEASGHKASVRKEHAKLAQLIYSTESMMGYRIANNMMEGNLLKENGKSNLYFKTTANRVSGATWGLLNLRPSIVGVEKTFRDKNYYDAGLCHHALDFWGNEIFFKDVVKASLPGEKGWIEELSAISKMKEKMKNDCRLSFLNHAVAPRPMVWNTIYVSGGPEEHVFTRLSQQLLVSASTVPYLRNIIGRYMVERATIGIQGEGRTYYSN